MKPLVGRLRALKRRLLGIWHRHVRLTYPVTAVMGPTYRRALRRIEIDITYACNLACNNCNRACPQALSGATMSVGQIRKFVEESVAKNVKWEIITLIGGEPTLHKDFLEILDMLRAYRDRHAPAARLAVSTNGFGPKVKEAIAAIPADVMIVNSQKNGEAQQDFNSVHMAPKDKLVYLAADFRNGCEITEFCGTGLTPYGYYPCAIAGAIDRVFGWDRGRKQLPDDGDTMAADLRHFCRHCGHFKRHEKPNVTEQRSSPTWAAAFDLYRQAAPKLTRY